MNNPSPDHMNTIASRLVFSLLWVALLLSAAPLAIAKAPAPRDTAPRPKIDAAVFETWLARGPQYLLSQVVPVPVTEGARFKGFRLSFWFPGHPNEVSSAWLRPGDVITRVNGRSVERPDQFLYLWKRLGESRRLMIEGWREEIVNGQTSRRDFAITFDIVDSPTPPPSQDGAKINLELKELKARPARTEATMARPAPDPSGASNGE
jgi:hypothetical protein